MKIREFIEKAELPEWGWWILLVLVAI